MKTWKKIALALLACVGVVVALVVWTFVDISRQLSDGREPELSGPSKWVVGAIGSTLAAVRSKDPGPPPPGMTAEQWKGLSEQLARHPRGDAELKRIAQYMKYKHDVDTLADMKRQTPPPVQEMQALARKIDADLDQRLLNGEVTSGEATSLKTQLLELLEADEAKRKESLESWRTQLAAKQPPPEAPDPRMKTLQERSQEVIARWQASGQKDEAALTKELEALRESIFNPAGAKAEPDR